MLDFPVLLLLQVKLPVVDRIHPQSNKFFLQDKTRQDNFIKFLHNTLMTDLAPQVAKANRGGPGTIKHV